MLKYFSVFLLVLVAMKIGQQHPASFGHRSHTNNQPYSSE